MNALEFTLLLAWTWIVAGFAVGLVFGLNFHREDWLGGYGSFKRRLYRLGHVSFFGLGFVNLMFYLTAQALGFSDFAAVTAAWAFVVGAISMPVCCFVMAHRPQARLWFAIPVGSLLAGGLLTLWKVIHHQPINL